MVTTIGVAIAVPEPWATQLQQYRASFGDRQAAAIPTHLTMVPPTDVDDELETVEKHLSEVAAGGSAFTITLRGTATFRPVSPVVFLAVSEGISACEQLAFQARQGPLQQALSFPYHPHVTVAHDVSDAELDRAFAELADFSCSFVVDSFLLYVHGPDAVWRPANAFPLGR